MTLETERLLLRPFEARDADVVYRFSADPQTTRYLAHFGNAGATPEQDTAAFMRRAVAGWQETPIRSREYVVTLKETGAAMGDGSIETLSGDTGEIGWILLPEYRGHGYVTEMGRALLRFGFEELELSRIVAHCDARNEKSYRVMERLGMRREGVARQVRPRKAADALKGDECTYALLKSEWEARRVMTECLRLPVRFERFMDVPALTDGEIALVCSQKREQNDVEPSVPSYRFQIVRGGEIIGGIDLRVGFTEKLFYAGNIGYDIIDSARGHGYAARACRLLAPVMRYHGMRAAIITNAPDNVSSRRVCEKLNARLLIRSLVSDSCAAMRAHGTEEVNVFLMTL